MLKDGYYECDICPRWFKIVDGIEIELTMSKNHDEILANNITILKKGECKHNKKRNDMKESKSSFYRRRSLQDNSRYHAFI